MPEFDHEDAGPYKQIVVAFKTPEDMKAFSKLIKQTLTDKTKSVWYPKAELESVINKRYVNGVANESKP